MEISKTEIIAYNKTEQALAELRTKYETVVFDVKSTKGMIDAKEARAELRSYRVAIEKTRVIEKAESIAYGRLVDSEAKRITVELEKLEDPIDSIIKAEEKRKADEKAEAQRIERERVDTIRARIGHIERWPLRCIGMSAERLDSQIVLIELEPINDALYMELKAEAVNVFEQSCAQLREMLSVKLDEEAKAEAQRLEEIRLETARVVREEAMRIEAEKLETEKAEYARIVEERRIEYERVRAELNAQQEIIDAGRKAFEMEKEAALLKLQETREIEEERLKNVATISMSEVNDPTTFQAKDFNTLGAHEEISGDRLKAAQEEWMSVNGPTTGRPSDREIISVLVDHYRVHELNVIEWLFAMDLPNAEDAICKEENLDSII